MKQIKGIEAAADPDEKRVEGERKDLIFQAVDPLRLRSDLILSDGHKGESDSGS